MRRVELGQIKLAQVWAQVQCENVPHVGFSKSQRLRISHILETRNEKMQAGLASRQRRRSDDWITKKRKRFPDPVAKTQVLIGNMASSLRSFSEEPFVIILTRFFFFPQSFKNPFGPSYKKKHGGQSSKFPFVTFRRHATGPGLWHPSGALKIIAAAIKLMSLMWKALKRCLVPSPAFCFALPFSYSNGNMKMRCFLIC